MAQPTLTLPALHYIAEEVTRQHRPPIAVAWMAEAWTHAIGDRYMAGIDGRALLTPSMLIRWGQLIEPERNANGIRTVALTAPKDTPLPAFVPWQLSSVSTSTMA